MTTDARRKYFRRNVGDPGDGTNPDVDVFSDEEIDDIYNEIDGYASTSDTEKIRSIQAVVTGFDWLLADAVKQVDYMQNDSRIEADSVPKHLLALRKVWSDKLDDETSAVLGPAFGSGVTRRIPSRRKAYPDA